ncbi:hypothetical protein LTR53_014670 [Teratosphaeriaceae sp. CCFEE 6253]|nr:hypothetical protein LTR53_014670 [Teratosphaeriaceae sp. CCFEE 6253]
MAQRPIPEERVAEVGALPSLPGLKRKESRWRTLGGLFGRKAARPSAQTAEPFYKVQVSQRPPREQWAAPASQTRPLHSHQIAQPLVETPSPSPGVLRTPGSISTHHSRTPSVNRGLARFEARAEADRHSFMPNVDSKLPPPRTSSHMKRGSGSTLPFPPMPLEAIRDSADLFRSVRPLRADPPSPAAHIGHPTPRTPRLDLDIPGAELERYSVMFEKLLEPRQSLLERRQSKVRRQRKDLPDVPSPIESCGPSPIEMLRVPALSPRKGGAAMMVKADLPQRSATSPHLKRVPSLTVSLTSKPSAATLRAPPQQEAGGVRPSTAIDRPRPIRRSKTAPPGSVSPVAPNFSRPTATASQLLASSSAERLPGRPPPESPLLGEASLPPTPTEIGMLRAPTSTTAAAAAAARSLHGLGVPRTRPRGGRGGDSLDAQDWAMLTSAPHSSSHSTVVSTPQRPQHTTLAAAGSAAPAYPRIKSPADLERQIVQVSVARQVSVSKARRLVQRATQPQPQSAGDGDGDGDGGRAGEGGRVGGRIGVALRPRVVEMKGKGERKSTHVVVIEGGED